MALGHTSTIFAIILALFVQSSLGNIVCEDLNKDSCAFAVSSSGKRCVLEKHVQRSEDEAYFCSTSEIEAGKLLSGLIETDDCIKACGLQRNVLGISSDSLLESRFTQKLCSNACYAKCPNIIDLYFNLAAGEGAYLPELCNEKGEKKHREMEEIKSSKDTVPVLGPESSFSAYFNTESAPAMTPF